jgi:hypothetical protein
MPNEFVARNGVIALNNSTVTGSLNVTSGITGSLFGTASWAVSSSFSLTASFALNAGASSPTSFTLSQTTPSTTWTVNHNLNNAYPSITIYDNNGYVIIPKNILANNANQTTVTFSYPATGYATVVVAGTSVTTASYALTATTASYFFTSSVTNATSTSYAATASSADSFNVRTSLTASNVLITGTLTATTIVAQTITSSVSWITGSTKFGSLSTNTHQFTGSITITGSLTIGSGSITGSRIDPRTATTASIATYTPDVSLADIFTITGQTASLAFNNPSGSPVNGQRMIIRIKDDGVGARALNFTGSQYRASTELPFPASSSLSKTLYLGFIYNSIDVKWDLLAKIDNF